jgi:GNAT superfamily N-acetyltransferase
VSGEIAIRAAAPHEREALEALQRRASLVWEDYREQLLANPDAIELPAEQIAEGRVFVAETDGQLAGFGVVLPREDGEAELDGLFVEPDGWGKGVGRRLIEEAARRAAALGARWLCVTANPRAEGFYLACGFELSGQAETQFGPARTMRKSV